MSNESLRVYDSVLGMLSSADNPTPLVRLNRVTPFQQTVVYAKLEWYNPFGSVKDRVAANMLGDAQDRGVPTSKLAEPVCGARGDRSDRLVGEESPDIRRHVLHSRIAPVAVFL